MNMCFEWMAVGFLWECWKWGY